MGAYKEEWRNWRNEEMYLLKKYVTEESKIEV